MTPGTLARRWSASADSDPRGTGSSEGGLSSLSHSSDSRCLGALSGSDLKRALARSQMVSDMAQNVGGDSVQPMVQARGMPTKGGSPS